MQTITEADVKSLFIRRDRNANKGNFGYVGVMGGCPSYSGAVKLANMAQAALRSGCGVSRLIVPKSITTSVSPYILESTLYEMDCDEDGMMTFPSSLKSDKCDFNLDLNSPECKKFTGAFTKLKALSVGMGWGTSDNYTDILKYILEELDINLIIDADGLNTLSQGHQNLLKDTGCNVVLTPHLMEFSRLSGYSIDEIKKNPVELSKEFAGKYNLIVLLKGADTIVTDGNEVMICDRGTPGMATAGSGDVLSGILTGLLGYMRYSVSTVAAGAYINAVAGELAADEFTEVSMTAGDTVNKIPTVVRNIINT